MDLDNLFLDNIFNKFDFNVKKLKINKLGNSSNLIYEFKDGNKEYILRISKNNLEKLCYYEEEMGFINYLFLGQGNVSRVISSKNNKLVEYIKYDGHYYFISIFEKAKGNIPDVNNENKWKSQLFYKWGKVMGKIHSLSKDYSKDNMEILRNQWDEDIYFNEGFWIEKLPLFLEYRRICSYSFMYKILEGKDLDERRKVYMTNRKEEIVSRIPYIDFNFKCIV